MRKSAIVTGVLATAMTVTLAGCSGDRATVRVVDTTVATTPSTVAQPVVPAASADFLRTSSERTARAASGRFAMTIGYEGLPTVGKMQLTAVGAFDSVNQRSFMSMDLGRLLAAAGGDVNVMRALSGAGDFEIIANGDDIYLRFALLKLVKSGINKEWVKVSASELGMDRAHLMTSLNAGPASVDAGSLVGFLQGAGATVTEVGQEAVMGAPTTHYSTTLTLSELAKAAPGDETKKLEDQLASLGIKDLSTVSIPADAWIDTHGFVRRLALKFNGLVPSAPQQSMTLDITMYDLDKAITIELPPDRDVQTMHDLSLNH
ncbi:MAG: hypothetical protein ABJD24_08380 [Acidimicrobiales bacterium]